MKNIVSPSRLSAGLHCALLSGFAPALLFIVSLGLSLTLPNPAYALDSFNGLNLGAAANSRLDPYAMPCKNFMALPPDGRTLVAAFLLGDTAPESGSDSYNPADVTADLRLLEKSCAARPSTGIGEALEDAEPEDEPEQSTTLLPMCMTFSSLKDATSAGAMLAWTLAYVGVADGLGAGTLDLGGFTALGNATLKKCADKPSSDLRDVVRSLHKVK